MPNRSRADAIKLKRRWKTVPPLLYKYYTQDRREFFGSFRVRFSQLAALNDPFELLVDMKPGAFREDAVRAARGVVNPLNFVGMAIKQILGLLSDPEKTRTTPLLIRVIVVAIMLVIAPPLVLLAYPFVSKYMRLLMAAVGDQFEIMLGKARDGLILIFSCSETWDSVPMWAHYAGNHTGFAIGLDPRSAFQRRNSKGDIEPLVPRKVAYQESIPTMSFGANGTDFLATKMSAWAYEREWRFTEMPDDATQRVSSTNCEILLFDVDPSSIKEIVFGAKCSKDHVSEIMHLLGMAGVTPEYYVVKRGSRYGFEREKIASHDQIPEAESGTAGLPSINDVDFREMEQHLSDMIAAAESHWLLGRLSSQKPKV